MIYTYADGRPIPKPERKEFAKTVEYLRAMWAYRDAIADCANKSFAEQFRKSLKGRRAPPFIRT